MLNKGFMTNVWKTDAPCVGEPLHQHLAASDHHGVTMAIENEGWAADLMESAGQI